MSSGIFDLFDRIFDFCESAKGKLVLAIFISISFIVYSINNPLAIMPPGVYYFGVIISTSMFFWSASLQKNKNTKPITILCGLAFLVWALVNTALRS